MADETFAVLEWELSLLPTGNVLFAIGYAVTPEDAVAGRTHRLQLAMTAEQARVLAEDLRQKAASSRQTTDTGRA